MSAQVSDKRWVKISVVNPEMRLEREQAVGGELVVVGGVAAAVLLVQGAVPTAVVRLPEMPLPGFERRAF
ncbi:unnamed protein product [Clonostachys byssicola]|uniref:Uncharacterized protein n=1 Tax=Clonostachys byssicola TaxID=160290 RepID=A0A9N9UIU3_9HYPO|nr:unnamed protein product [Clonostachys byssicola]